MVVQWLPNTNMQKKRGLEAYLCLSGLGKWSAADSRQATNQAQLYVMNCAKGVSYHGSFSSRTAFRRNFLSINFEALSTTGHTLETT